MQLFDPIEQKIRVSPCVKAGHDEHPGLPDDVENAIGKPSYDGTSNIAIYRWVLVGPGSHSRKGSLDVIEKRLAQPRTFVLVLLPSLRDVGFGPRPKDDLVLQPFRSSSERNSSHGRPASGL